MRTMISRITQILTILFQLTFLARYDAINVAFNKMSTDCKSNDLSNLMFDRDTTYYNVEIIISKCPSFAFVDVNLGGYFEIHYVVIYEGKSEDSTKGQLDYFKVKFHKGESLIFCSEFPGRSSEWNGGMRVNCAASYDLYDTLQVQSRKNNGLYISEIEVHTLAIGISSERLLIYRGCYRRFEGMGNALKQPILDKCHEKCLELKTLFVAIRGNKYCYCNDKYPEKTEVPMDNCDMECNDGKRFCGGTRYYSIYLVSLRLPFYKGCFQKLDHSINGHFKSKVTTGSCLHRCDNYNYAFMNGMSCFCWNDFNNMSSSKYNNCDATSIASDHYSVYETCFMLSSQAIKCSQLFKCVAPYDEFGGCGGVCQSGFSGDHCLERITRVNSMLMQEEEINKIIEDDYEFPLPDSLDAIFAPPCNFSFCAEFPKTKCNIIKGKEKCVCIKGYESDRETGGCKDRDECEFEPCNEKSSECVNLPGKYTCKCFDGFVKDEYEQCLANETTEGLSFHDAGVQRFISAVAVLTLLFAYCLYAPYTTSHVSTTESSIEPRPYP